MPLRPEGPNSRLARFSCFLVEIVQDAGGARCTRDGYHVHPHIGPNLSVPRSPGFFNGEGTGAGWLGRTAPRQGQPPLP